MLENAPATIMLPVVNMDRARNFYQSQLGLKADGFSPTGEFFFTLKGGTRLGLIKKDSPTKAEHTALSFEVSELESVVKRLAEKGIKFEDYDLPGLKTVNKVCVIGSEKAAWFKDPEQNILCVHEVLPRK